MDEIRVDFIKDEDGMIVGYKFKDSELMQSSIQHETSETEIRVDFIKDEDGMIVGYKFKDSELMQSDDFANDLDHIEHFGVKGMRWGVRKDLYEGRTQFGDIPKTLTNEELSSRIKRLQMERKYNELRGPTLTRGTTKIKRALVKMTGETANTLAKEAIMRNARKTISKSIAKKVTKTGAGIIDPGITSFT
jgi:hypothetical protein